MPLPPTTLLPNLLGGVIFGVGMAGAGYCPGTIVAESSAPGCRQIVRTNREYFDVSLPRTAPQILYVTDCGRCVRVNGTELTSRPIDRWDSPPQGCVQHAKIWREVDWTKIAALVTQ